MKSSSKVVVFIVGILALVLCGAGAFFFVQDSDEKQLSSMEVVIVGKNEYKSELRVELRNTSLTVDDFDYQWWYKDSSSDDKNDIDGATQYKYIVEEEVVGKNIGVSVKYKSSTSDSTSYEDSTDVEENESVTVKPISTSLTLEKSNGIYNGTAIKANSAEMSNDAPVVYTFYTDDLCTIKTTTDTGASVEGGAPIDAGNYYVKASVEESSSYESSSSLCVEHTIVPAELTVSWNKGNYTYNGQKQGPQASVINTATDEQVNVFASSATNAGNYVSEATCQSVVGGRGKCSNYRLINQTQDYKINVAHPSVKIDSKTAVYSGAPVDANKAEIQNGGEVTYTYYTDNRCTKKTNSNHGVATEGGAPVDAGKYYVQVSVGATGNTSSAVSSCIEHTILPKTVDVNWNQTSFTYDGSSKVPDVSVETGSDEAMILSATSGTVPGNYEANVVCRSVYGGRGKCSNYLLNNTVGSFSILKATPSVSLSGKNVLYNGKVVNANTARTVSGLNITYKYYTDKSCIIETTGNVGSSTNGAAPIDAGNYYVRAFVNGNDKYNNSQSACVSHIIRPINVSLSNIVSNFTYDGTEKRPTFNVNYSKVNDEEISIVADGKTNAGSYNSNIICQNVEGGRGKCSNYLMPHSISLVIKKAQGSITVEETTKTFNNSFDLPKYSKTGDGNVTFRYYSDSSCTTSLNQPVNAGQYYVRANMYSGMNYNGATSECIKYTIDKYKTSVIWNSGSSFTYNGKEQGPMASYSGLYGSVKMNTTKAINAGTYTSEATCVDGGNNQTLCSNYDFSGAQMTKTYNINKSSVSIKGVDSIYNLSYPIRTSINFSITSNVNNASVNGSISCFSDNTSIAACNRSGNNQIVIIPNGSGTAKITLKYEGDNNHSSASKTISVNVSVPVMTLNLVSPVTSTTISTYSIEYGKYIELPSASQDGYEFLGWSQSFGGPVSLSAGNYYGNTVSGYNSSMVLYAIMSPNFVENLSNGSFKYLKGISFNGAHSFSTMGLQLGTSASLNFYFYNYGDTNIILNAMGSGMVKVTNNNTGEFKKFTLSGGFKDYTLSAVNGHNPISIELQGGSYMYIKTISVTPKATTSSRVVEEPTLMDLVMNIKMFIRDAWYSTVEKLRKLFN